MSCGRVNPPECQKCKLPPRADGHDQCLGRLPGVMNACCGHTEPRWAYVQFSPRVRLAGRTALACIWVLKIARGAAKIARKVCFR